MPSFVETIFAGRLAINKTTSILTNVLLVILVSIAGLALLWVLLMFFMHGAMMRFM